jgi:hypothetical protein
MTNIVKGLIIVTTFGIISIIPMIFMTFEDKTRAMTGSIISRLAIGIIILNSQLPVGKRWFSWTDLKFTGRTCNQAVCTNS